MTRDQRIQQGICVDCNWLALKGSQRCWLCGDMNRRRTRKLGAKKRMPRLEPLPVSGGC